MSNTMTRSDQLKMRLRAGRPLGEYLGKEAADRIEVLEAENGALKTALRVNMLRHVSGVTHAEIDAIIEKASAI